MASEFQIQGLDAVLAKMRGLAPKMQAKGLRSAGTKAMRIVRDAARANAKRIDDPTTASNIAKAITTRYDGKGSKRNGGVMVKVGVAGGAKPVAGNKDTGHWRLLEFGTEKMRAQPFMRPALADNVRAVTDKFVTEASNELDKIIAKGA